ncbi:MAG: hypothetical protein RLO81_09675 [Fulvivirga sp.]|uniref:hypothetical protein n=1 Tax=Fulvivirga sp. TaxID=1931237 RepID=UPI0032EAEE2A
MALKDELVENLLEAHEIIKSDKRGQDELLKRIETLFKSNNYDVNLLQDLEYFISSEEFFQTMQTHIFSSDERNEFLEEIEKHRVNLYSLATNLHERLNENEEYIEIISNKNDNEPFLRRWFKPLIIFSVAITMICITSLVINFKQFADYQPPNSDLINIIYFNLDKDSTGDFTKLVNDYLDDVDGTRMHVDSIAQRKRMELIDKLNKENAKRKLLIHK